MKNIKFILITLIITLAVELVIKFIENNFLSGIVYTSGSANILYYKIPITGSNEYELLFNYDLVFIAIIVVLLGLLFKSKN